MATTEKEELGMWIIIGADGQLGRCLQKCLQKQDIDFVGTTRKDLDITDESQMENFLHHHSNSIVINTAAWTAVDDAEDRYGDAHSVNAEAVGHLAKIVLKTQSRLIHISTDYVFDGTAKTPYSVESETNPINAYGKTKRDGERLITHFSNGSATIIRTAWLYSEFGRNFVKTMVNKALNRQAVRVVDDQVGQPTNAHDLAHLIVQVGLMQQSPKLIHGTNSGNTSWFGLTKEIFSFFDCDPKLVTPVATTDFPTKAKRPNFSVFSHDEYERLNLQRLPEWSSSLRRDLPLIAEMITRGTDD